MPRRTFTIRPLTSQIWGAFETLFGARGACGGCWCMTPRLTRAQYDANQGDGNRRLMKRRVEAGPPPGLVAFFRDEPIGWISVEPRSRFPRLATSRVLKPVDAAPVWSITCFFVRKDWRGRGVSRELIEAAVKWAKSNGAELVEAYPIEPKSGEVPPVFAWTGLVSAFEKCGFVEVARRSPTRPIVRRGTARARKPRAPRP